MRINGTRTAGIHVRVQCNVHVMYGDPPLQLYHVYGVDGDANIPFLARLPGIMREWFAGLSLFCFDLAMMFQI